MAHAPIPANFKKAVSRHWQKMQNDTKSFTARHKKKAQPIPVNREDELSAMEQFIKEKGVTIYDPVTNPNEQPIFQQYRPQVLS